MKSFPKRLAASQNIFFDGMMADKSIGISLAASKPVRM